MYTIFGDFIQDIPNSQEYLILSFSSGSIPLQKKWHNNCLSADFLADYLSIFCLNPNCHNKNKGKHLEVKSTISYIANELLENAVKYSNPISKLPISIQVSIISNRIIFQITNSLKERDLEKFQQYIQKLLNSDTNQLYLDILEQNALEQDRDRSGLGFLTMVNDYDAKIGWKFETLSQKSREMSVTTMIQLQV